MNNADNILRKYHLKNTGCRKYIINELLSKPTALSEHEIKSSLPDLFDRVTFYRSLKTLEEKSIIHKIVLNNTTVKYALNEGLKLNHDHAHFHCQECGEVSCVDIDLEGSIKSLGGYTIKSVHIVLEGICPTCKNMPAK